MAVTAKLYSHLPLNALKKLISDLAAGGTTIKVMLCTSTYAPAQDTHENKGDVTNEVTGTGYTAGGATLASKTCTVTGRVTTFDAADTEWLNSTITARYAVIYDDTPATDAEKKLLMYVDFGEDKSSSDGTFKLEWNASGIFTMTVAA